MTLRTPYFPPPSEYLTSPPPSTTMPSGAEGVYYAPPGISLQGRTGPSTLARASAIATIDATLDRLRAQPQPVVTPAARYVLYFLLVTILLSARDFGFDPGPAREAIYISRPAVQANRRHGVMDWQVVLRAPEKTRLFVRYIVFLNMLYAAGISSVLYLRDRDLVKTRLIDRQNQELSLLSQRKTLEIEEISRLLRDLRRAQSQLLSAEKLASVGRLSATLAHEIRNPLGIIMSSIGFVAEDIARESPEGQALDLVRQEIKRLDRIIGQLLDFSRPRVPSLESLDCNELLSGWLLALREELQARGIELYEDFDPGAGEIYIDSEMLYQAVLNLLLNSADALKDSPTKIIRVVTQRETLDQVRIEIIDSGPGIAPDILEQVFEPFFTTKVSGTGLGLAMVRKVLEALGGSIELVSAVGEGTIARMRVPTGPPESDPLAQQIGAE